MSEQQPDLSTLERVEDPAGSGSAVYIDKGPMSWATKQRVLGWASSRQGNSSWSAEYVTAMLRLGVRAWEGPAFAGAPCTPENIDRLMPWDLGEAAWTAIQERNERRASANPTMAGGGDSEASPPAQPES